MSGEMVMLTIVTKYSRVPSDCVKLKGYNTMIEIGKNPILISPDGSRIIRNSIREKSDTLGITIINLAILPDHIHINLITNDVSVIDIAQGIKGYTSFVYNRQIGVSQKGKGQQNKLRAKGYAVTYLRKKDHQKNTIEYVDSNHQKHTDRWGDDLQTQYQDPSDLCSNKNYIL